jgi:hypothetical protein
MDFLSTIASGMAQPQQTVQQYADFYKGTPFETEFNKYATYTSDENGGGGWGWNSGGDTAFKNYLQQQSKLSVQQGMNPSATLIDTSKYGTASDLAAAVAQSQYDNWKSTYFPAMQAARDMTTYATPEIVDKEVTKGMAAADQASTNAAGQQSRTFQRFGMQPTAEQRDTIADVATNNKTLSEVDAANRVRMDLADRNKSIMAGSITGFTAKI